MKTRLYLIRHGITEWNSLNKFQGATDVPLSNEGIEQAAKVSERLKDYGIEAIYSSDLQRAYDTAKALSEKINIDIIKDKRLREINFGNWEGLTRDEILERYKESYTAWRLSPKKASLSGEGSLSNAVDRGLNCINEIIADNKHKKIAVFAHSAIIKAIIIGALDLDLDFYLKFWLGNTSITTLDYNDEAGFILSSLNDINHLN